MALESDKIEQGLKDLRVLHAGDETTQDSRLLFQIPELYYPKSVAGIPKEDCVDSSGLDALIMVVRRVMVELPLDDRGLEHEVVREQEQANPLLRLAMADFVSTDKEALQAARYLALKAFYEGPLEGKDLSFLALAEHELMHKTIWSRIPFLLHSPKCLMKEDGKWRSITLTDLAGGAQNSLIHFSTGNLGQVISDKFGTFPDGQHREIMKQSNIPATIRVRYDFDASDPKTFRDLRKIVVDMRRMKHRPSGAWELTPPGEAMTTYRLIAEVRLSNSPWEKDTIRTYLEYGEVIPTPNAFPIHHKQPLGKENTRYMLYYARGADDIPGEETLSEIPPPFPTEKERLFQQLLDGDTLDPRSPSPQPRPAPSLPLA
ncbi:hypothetical protein F5Y11DRAFT_167597 [Daldinia sp. FL1419]|nr:hypothetical protein F5Y11DRAFT_167597 [Daldinia sp. FL1419]